MLSFTCTCSTIILLRHSEIQSWPLPLYNDYIITVYMYMCIHVCMHSDAVIYMYMFYYYLCTCNCSSLSRPIACCLATDNEKLSGSSSLSLSYF